MPDHDILSLRDLRNLMVEGKGFQGKAVWYLGRPANMQGAGLGQLIDMAGVVTNQARAWALFVNSAAEDFLSTTRFEHIGLEAEQISGAQKIKAMLRQAKFPWDMQSIEDKKSGFTKPSYAEMRGCYMLRQETQDLMACTTRLFIHRIREAVAGIRASHPERAKILVDSDHFIVFDPAAGPNNMVRAFDRTAEELGLGAAANACLQAMAPGHIVYYEKREGEAKYYPMKPTMGSPITKRTSATRMSGPTLLSLRIEVALMTWP